MSNFPRLRVEEFEPYLDSHPITEEADGYAQLGSFSFEHSTADKPRLQNGGVRHGFEILAGLIRAGANLYQEVKPEDETSVNGLRKILLASRQAPYQFAGLPLTVNGVAEKEFGLKDSVVPPTIHELYSFETGGSGVEFKVNPVRFARVVEQGWLMQHGGDIDKQCKHRRLVADYFWPQMVNLAADSPRLVLDTLYPREEKDT